MFDLIARCTGIAYSLADCTTVVGHEERAIGWQLGATSPAGQVIMGARVRANFANPGAVSIEVVA